ncbi:CAAD domain-containing protein [Nostoc sp. FACHB-152]|uniref:CAAD domain-containing protein n=1 Tax=unclassified Nostoc TaxID=2593658 RepID=UPI0016892DBC|nr:MULTISPECIES: CAAD domain-containing protein [unclassified Nostoc]MBD2448433.1 CAAD domain-containing protein [Nostoc sp. FACHB-152]MBD2470873.1 CAAD domain-containing protein [Nostoc sp. FACHB-145]
METQIQQKEYAEPSLAKNIVTIQDSEPGSLAKLTNTEISNNQGADFGRNISDVLQQLPQNIVEFTYEYKLPVVSFAFIVLMNIGLRLVLAVLYGVRQIPFAPTFFELIGIGYTTWFVSRNFFAEHDGRS